MRNHYSPFLFVLISCWLFAQGMVTWAAPIDLRTAREKAVTFMQSKGMIAPTTSGVGIRSVVPSSGKQPYAHTYLFNAPQGGYVIVSGDDRTAPILGYSTQGHLDLDRLPENMDGWLKGYDEAISQLRTPSANAAAQPHVKAIAFPVRKAVAPLITSVWNQNRPFNDSVPVYYDEKTHARGKCASGCVATAMSQLINFYRYPDQTTAVIPGYENRNVYKKPNGETFQAILPSIPAGSRLDWANMLDNYNGRYTPEQGSAVANLMLYCGISVYMNYGPSSGAGSENVAIALKKYFGYSQDIKYLNRGKFSIDDWEAMLYHELEEGRPVYYAGYSKGGGHAFVCDGFDGKGFYHINWGWGGASNGYFLISVLNPYNTSGIGASSSSDGFSGWQEMITGIQPANRVAPSTDTPHLIVNIVDVPNNNSVRFSFSNPHYKALQCEVGLGILQDTGDILPVYTFKRSLQARTTNVETQLTLRSQDLTNIDNGTYILVPISRKVGTEKWYLSSDNRKEVSLTKNNFRITCKLWPDKQPPHELKVKSIKAKYPPIVGNEMELLAQVENTGGEYYGPIYLFAAQDEEKGDPKNYANVAIRRNSANQVSFFFTLEEAGTYHLWMATDQFGYNVIGTGEIKVNEGIKDASGVIIENVFGGNGIVNNHLADTIYLKNTTQESVGFGLTVFAGPAGQATPYVGKFNLTLEPGERLPYYLDLGRKEPGNYTVVIQGLKNTLRYNVRMMPVVTYWDGDGTKHFEIWNNTRLVIPDSVAAVEFCNEAGKRLSRIQFNNNPSTIYYMSPIGRVPAYLARSKNMVKDGVADSITFVDGHNSYVPYPIHAKRVTYLRTLQHTASKTNDWESMVLPFTPQTITREDTQAAITWCQNERPNAPFYLKSLKGISPNDEAVFVDADSCVSNTPYLIAVRAELRNVPLKFTASEADIASVHTLGVYTARYRFTGLLGQGFLPHAYTMNSDGSAFVRHDLGKVGAFRAAFLANPDALNTVSRIPILAKGVDIIDGIEEVTAGGTTTYTVYRLDGRLVLKQAHSLGHLPSGLYIINGKKCFIP